MWYADVVGLDQVLADMEPFMLKRETRHGTRQVAYELGERG